MAAFVYPFVPSILCRGLKISALSTTEPRAPSKLIGWLVGFGLNGPFSQYFSLYRAVSQREEEREKKG